MSPALIPCRHAVSLRLFQALLQALRVLVFVSVPHDTMVPDGATDPVYVQHGASMASEPPRTPRGQVIDFHAHIVVPEVYAAAAEHNIFFELPTDAGVTYEMQSQIKARGATVVVRMSDISERIAKMDHMGVDVQVLSPSLVHQGLEWADATTSLRLARTTNDWVARAVATHPQRLIGLGTVPLHAPALATAELERCMGELALAGVAVSTTAGAMELGDAALRPFWEKAQALAAVVYIHPGGNRDRRLKRYHLWNSVGQAFEEAMAISSLMYDGVLEAFPQLRICVSHGGGYMPYYMGRIERNYAEKANTRINMKKPPLEYLRMLYFDSCVYERPVLEHLVERVGAERVVLGSDYPVGEPDPVGFVTGIDGLSNAQKERIVRANAAALLDLR
jgi:aminocarboxymuconate-semialdehyde decarboxylase